MSLIITTSKLSENDNVGQLPSENPSNYTNFFRSPITIPPNSEIAVESVKMNRTANVNIKDNSFLCHYFGQIADEVSDRPFQIEAPRRIRPDQGVYNLTEYKQELNDKLNKQYGHPSIFGNSSVLINTTATGQENGLQFKFIQRSPSATNRTTSLTSTPYYNIETPFKPGEPSNAFNWTPASGIFARTGLIAANGVQNASCIGILKDVPFSNTSLDMTVTVVNASATYWKVGLSRPHVQYESIDNASRHTINTYPYRYSKDNNYRMATGVSRTSGPEHYDFLVQCVTGAGANNGLRMFCSLNRNTETSLAGLGPNWKMYEMKYWESGGSHSGDAMTASAFYASYDRIRFKSDGIYLNVFAGLKNKAGYEQLMGANLSRDVDKCFKPRGDTTYALYPQFNIGSGNIELTEYQSEVNPVDETYRYPVYNASDAPVGNAGPRQYVPGNDMYSCNRVPSADSFNIVNGKKITLYRNIDNVETDSDAIAFVDGSETYTNYFSTTAGLTTYFQPRDVNASGGSKNKHVLIGNKYTLGSVEDYLLESQRFPNMSFGLGYLDRAIMSESDGHTDGYISGENTNTVTFTSPHEIDKMPISGFIRIPNLTHQSFNGAQSGISKIVYQVPQFSNDGRQYGPLYFAPGEKTYIDLKNPASTILNSLQIQIVGADEKELKTLTGTTQIVFHIRQKL